MSGKPTNKGTSPEFTPEEQAELDRLAAMQDEDIDFSDVPEIRDFSGFRRAELYRPVKKPVTLRLDADVVEWFKRQAPGGEPYQSAINRVLREYVQQRLRAS